MLPEPAPQIPPMPQMPPSPPGTPVPLGVGGSVGGSVGGNTVTDLPGVAASGAATFTADSRLVSDPASTSDASATAFGAPAPGSASTGAEPQGWDLPEVWERFSLRVDGTTWDSHVAITGMHCASCSLTVEQALRSVPGVHDVSVNAASQMARVRWSPQRTRPSQWMQSLERAGYGAVPFDDLQALRAQERERRVLLWRWLVAGFCMMQVMMYAVPAYTAQAGELGREMEQLLRWASWVLTLPVLLFASQPFFAGAWAGLRQRRMSMDVPVALGILIAFAASSAGTFAPDGAFGREVWYDSVTMFVFFLLSARLLEQRLRTRTLGALQALTQRLPAVALRATIPAANAAPDAKCDAKCDAESDAPTAWEQVPVARLRVGDRVQVRAGEVFAADATVISGHSEVDEAVLTGESHPRPRAPGDAVIAGSHNLSGVLEVRVDRVGSDTRYAGIVALMREAATAKPAAVQLADRLAQPFLWAVLAASALAAAWWWPTDPSHAVAVAVAVLIVTCPCALSLATPAALLSTAGALARRGVLVRRLAALEDAARVDHLLFDKTGTLTHERMQLVDINGRPDVGADAALQLAAALARHSVHPVSRALVDAAQRAAADACAVPVVYGVIEVPGQGLKGWRAMADDVLPAEPLRLGKASFAGPLGLQASPGHGQSRASDSGLQVHLSDLSGWLASFTLQEGLRDDAVQAIDALRKQGMGLELVSGDRAGAARALARRLALARWTAPCLPADKLARLQALQQQGHVVAMVGDGINDAPVLARANLSVTLGAAAPIASSQADVLVPGAKLTALPLLLAQARRTRRVVRENLAWAALYNLVAVPLAIAGYMPAWLAGLGMAGSSLLVVLNAARLSRLPDSD